MRYQCSPYHANNPFYPIAEQIRRAAGFVGNESAATRLDKLEAMAALSGLNGPDVTPFLAALLSVPTEGRYPRLELPPSEVRERTIAALIDCLSDSRGRLRCSCCGRMRIGQIRPRWICLVGWWSAWRSFRCSRW